MSLLNFPDEVTLQFLQKLNLYERINVCRTHPRLWPLCFDTLLDMSSTKTISLYELRQLYQQSRTEKERDQCFDPRILDRLRTKSFNEVVHMNMDPESNQFFANHKILHSFKGRIVLEGENEQCSDNFHQQFLSLIDKIEGNLLLMFVDVKFPEKKYLAVQGAETLSRKLERGEKVFCIELVHLQTPKKNHGLEIQHRIIDGFTIYYTSYPRNELREHSLRLQKKNSGANTETLIGMINEDRFMEAKQHLGKLLPMVKAAELSGRGSFISCPNCDAHKEINLQVMYLQKMYLQDEIYLLMFEPAWSNCAGCRVER